MANGYDIFKSFFQSEKAGGFILIGCTIVSIVLANTGASASYTDFWHKHLDLSIGPVSLDYSIEHWVNDGLMAIFFLLVGLEIERELYVGELSSIKNAMLPILAAIGGMAAPALIHFAFNAGTDTVGGYGIPMATDIAFALGILSLLGNRVPVSLKIFLTALAIIDDLGAIAVIALFYTKSFSAYYLFAALAVFALLFIAGKKKVSSLPFFLIGGVVMWYLMLKSGVHATISGVLLAFAIPFRKEDSKNSSFRLQKGLHYPVAFVILPIFALANTAIQIPASGLSTLGDNNSLGIMLGLIAGKFIGIFLISYLAVKMKWATMGEGITWRHLAGVALLGGIGFTMSMFITNLAFEDAAVITSSKMSILLSSFVAALLGYLVIKSARAAA